MHAYTLGMFVQHSATGLKLIATIQLRTAQIGSDMGSWSHLYFGQQLIIWSNVFSISSTIYGVLYGAPTVYKLQLYNYRSL